LLSEILDLAENLRQKVDYVVKQGGRNVTYDTGNIALRVSPKSTKLRNLPLLVLIAIVIKLQIIKSLLFSPLLLELVYSQSNH
jgi:hypothetical protein